jgi:fucose permease
MKILIFVAQLFEKVSPQALLILMTIFLSVLFPPVVMLGLCAVPGKNRKKVPGRAR